jgi:hypothetical protein
MTPEEKLKALGLTLPAVRTPPANFVPFKLDGKTIYVSGQGPTRPDGSYYVGKVGRDVTWQEDRRPLPACRGQSGGRGLGAR